MEVALLAAGRKLRADIPNEAAALELIGDRLIKLGRAIQLATPIAPSEFEDRRENDSILLFSFVNLKTDAQIAVQFPLLLLLKYKIDPDDLFREKG